MLQISLLCKMQVKLSVVIITFNEEKNIGRCLDSVKEVADEILVVDSFSTDATEEICISKGAHFLKNNFKGHIEQKNFACNKSKFDYVLSLDADECLSSELAKSILKVKNNWSKDAYSMNRLTNYCGKWIYHSGWYPDKKVRLFKKGSGKWGGINPHDRFNVSENAKIGHLEGDILHYSYYSIEEHLQQIDKFSSIGANELFKKGIRSNNFKILYKSLARFLKLYVVKKGFLDGAEGITISRMSAYANYLKYSKLLKLQNEKKPEL